MTYGSEMRGRSLRRSHEHGLVAACWNCGQPHVAAAGRGPGGGRLSRASARSAWVRRASPRACPVLTRPRRRSPAGRPDGRGRRLAGWPSRARAGASPSRPRRAPCAHRAGLARLGVVRRRPAPAGRRRRLHSSKATSRVRPRHASACGSTGLAARAKRSTPRCGLRWVRWCSAPTSCSSTRGTTARRRKRFSTHLPASGSPRSAARRS